MSLTLAESAAVVGDLRRARRKQRVSAIHWVDALYQVYITGLVALIATVLASGAVGDDEVGASTLADVRVHGAAAVGVVAALAVFLGLRSGSRGGPLALERPDVRHVLLAPVDRGVALRYPAWRQLRFLTFVGAAVGATAGQLALRRLPGNAAEWLFFGALFGVVVVGLGFGSALVAAGTGLRSWLATLVGGLLLAWSVADALDRAPTAPGTIAGRLALWPLEAEPLALLAVAVAAVLVAAGMRLVAGTSLEAAERRTALVGQLRFAVTLQDLRTVLVLRRQLAQERPRSRPWVPALGRSPRYPVWQRGLRSVARWPASRIVRVLVLAAVAGLAMRGVWAGTTPLVLVVGVALWIAALDAAEPLGQEIDHPGRTDAFPFPRGQLFLQHLPVVALVSLVTGLLAGAVALAPIGDEVPVGVALLGGALAGLLAGGGAVVSVVQGAPEAVDMLSMSTPEIAGARTVIRTAWPPGLAVIGTLPLLAARAAERGISDPPPLTALATVALPLGTLLVLLGGWVRLRDDIHAWIKQATDQMSPSKAVERVAAEREAAEAREAEALRESRALAGIEEDDAADGEDGEAGAVAADTERASRAKAPPRPAPKAKPRPNEPAPGFRGGTSAKPVGRKRDQNR
ncbi:MAG TPA: hypothetical protein VHK88_06360 [Aquihabitans sp.]|nr:hypothetical protein [Aquihabitans sp.]